MRKKRFIIEGIEREVLGKVIVKRKGNRMSDITLRNCLKKTKRKRK